MRILHVITGLRTGGAEKSLFNILAEGLGNAAENYIISLEDEGKVGAEIRALDVPIDSLHIRPPFRIGPLALFRLRRRIFSFNPDIIQGWMYHGNLAAWLGAKTGGSNARLLWNIRHSLYDIALEKWTSRLIIRLNGVLSGKPSRIIYNSMVARDQHRDYGFDSGADCIIRNGVNVDRFKPVGHRRDSLRKELGLSDLDVAVAHVARFHPMKGHHRFIAAAARLVRKDARAHFLLAGRGVTPHSCRLCQIVPDDLRGHFHFLGERQDIPNIFNAADLFCLSSQWGEACPNVLLEAMAAGVPCVTTDVGDSRYLVGNSGVVVEPGGCEGLYVGLSKMFDVSARERMKLGLAARSRVTEKFQLKSVASEYEKLYEGILSATT